MVDGHVDGIRQGVMAMPGCVCGEKGQLLYVLTNHLIGAWWDVDPSLTCVHIIYCI